MNSFRVSGLAGFLASLTIATALDWAPGAGWSITPAAISGAGKGDRWEALMSQQEWRDACVACAVTIRAAGQPGGNYPGNNWCGPAAGTDEFMPGYEAGLVFRAGAGGYYRVCLSSVYQEVGVWRTDGGWLGVADAPVKVGEAIPLAVSFSGEHIQVTVKGIVALDITDPRPLPAKGTIGLAVCKSAAEFRDVTVNAATFAGTSAPAASTFKHRVWHGQEWFFCGPEPIARYDRKDMTLHQIKFSPGFRPIGLFPLCWLQYLGPEWYANRLLAFEVLEQGEKLKFRSQGKTPNDEITSTYVVTITRSAGNGTFDYDVDADFGVNEGKEWKNAYGLEFCNFLPYNIVTSSVTLPAAERWPNYYGWMVWKAEDGKVYKHPINHSGFYPALGGDRGKSFTVAKTDGFIGFFAEEISPVCQVVQASEEIVHALCAWSHDIHLDYNRPAQPMKAGTRYAIHYQMQGWPRAKSEAALAAAVFPPDARNLDWAYPVYETGVNRFQNGVAVATPHQTQLWRKGGTACAWYDKPDWWDKTVGHGDSFSLRIDGPYSIHAPIGPSWFQPPFTAKRHVISAWVKLDNVRGNGLYLGFSCGHNRNARDNFSSHLTGTRDWTQIGFVTEKLSGFVQGSLIVGLDGTGSLWVDDVQIRPLADGEEPNLPVWEQTPAPTASPDLLTWLRLDEKAGRGAFDAANHGHSAELRDLQWCTDPVRGSSVRFDGKGMMTIESADELNFTTGFSFSFWIRPDLQMPQDGVSIMRKYNHLGLGLSGKNAPYRLRMDINGKWNLHMTEALVPGDAWSQVTATYDNKLLRLFLNGRKVWEKEQVEEKVMPSGFPLCLGGFWHEGRITPNGLYAGLLNEVRIVGRALGESEVQQQFEATCK